MADFIAAYFIIFITSQGDILSSGFLLLIQRRLFLISRDQPSAISRQQNLKKKGIA
jgi:hypothetical protein